MPNEDQEVQEQAEKPATIEISIPLEEMPVLTKYIAAGHMVLTAEGEEMPRAIDEWLTFAEGLDKQGIIEL